MFRSIEKDSRTSPNELNVRLLFYEQAGSE